MMHYLLSQSPETLALLSGVVTAVAIASILVTFKQ
jgi:hypothetical protein